MPGHDAPSNSLDDGVAIDPPSDAWDHNTVHNYLGSALAEAIGRS